MVSNAPNADHVSNDIDWAENCEWCPVLWFLAILGICPGTFCIAPYGIFFKETVNEMADENIFMQAFCCCAVGILKGDCPPDSD